MKASVVKAKWDAETARAMLRVGKISMEEAKRRCRPYIELVNEGAKKMSKQYGNTFRAVTLTGFLR